MRRIILWIGSTVSVLVLLFGYHTSTSASMAAVGTSTPYTSQKVTGSGSGSGGTAAAGGSGSGGSGSGSGASGSNSASTKTVTGNVVQTQWGPVQVQLTIKGSTIASVSVLQYPSGNGRDDQINSYALPILIQETTDKQSAQIDMVSGATVTSTGYLQSLQSALDQA